MILITGTSVLRYGEFPDFCVKRRLCRLCVTQIIEIGGVKIGLFGLVTGQTDYIINARKY